MATDDDLLWFKTQFGAVTDSALLGTPFTLDLITAIATQESYEVWGRARKTHSVGDVLKLCVGDIIDAPGRNAFPHSRTALEAVKDGPAMFQIARRAIEGMATVATEYQKYLHNPNKFAHAFGIFQYDIQVFREDPDFFLNQRWGDYGACLAKCLMELEQKRRVVFGHRTDLSRDDLVYVAIAYNKGSAHVGAGFAQGFRGDDGRYYGQEIDSFMRQASRIAAPAAPPPATPAEPAPPAASS